MQYEKATEKSIVTRALWCLSSQNFHSHQISRSVPQVITLATGVILEHGFGSLAVESLNVFRRIHQQCPREFGLVVSMWYKGVIVLLQCKVAKFQRKAHSFAVMFETSIASNSYLVSYLCKELKERGIAAMLGYMEERGKDPILVMSIWSHFVTVLGQSLHRHSSFLNEMLRVVEMVCSALSCSSTIYIFVYFLAYILLSCFSLFLPAQSSLTPALYIYVPVRVPAPFSFEKGVVLLCTLYTTYIQ